VPVAAWVEAAGDRPELGRASGGERWLALLILTRRSLQRVDDEDGFHC